MHGSQTSPQNSFHCVSAFASSFESSFRVRLSTESITSSTCFASCPSPNACASTIT
jgi:hypothetical protein